MMTPRLRQFLLVALTSSQPGEIVAAITKARAELTKIGKDVHQLVDGMLAETPQAKASKPPPPPPMSEHAQDARWLLDNAPLSLREHEFCESMLRWRGYPTERQQAWLDDLMRRYCWGE